MASIDVLVDGYARRDGDVAHVAGTVSLVRSGDLVLVVDPGMVTHRDRILDPLQSLGVEPSDVTDVVISHHHPDHTVNIALFPAATVHDHWASYRGDVWRDRPAEGLHLAEDVVLWETPGHSPQDLSTVVTTDEGVAVCTHLWWFEGLEGDPRATDIGRLLENRQRVLERATLVVPGHGPTFEVGARGG